MVRDTHDNDDDLSSDTWQSVGAVTAKLLLRLKQVDFHAVDDEKLVDDQPRNDELVEGHAAPAKRCEDDLTGAAVMLTFTNAA